MENKLWCFVSMALIAVGSITTSYAKDDGKTPIQFIPVKDVQINDAFWTPKFNRWNSVTVPDVFDKFEGKHLKTAEEQNNNNIFMDFDEVAAGKRAQVIVPVFLGSTGWFMKRFAVYLIC